MEIVDEASAPQLFRPGLATDPDPFEDPFGDHNAARQGEPAAPSSPMARTAAKTSRTARRPGNVWGGVSALRQDETPGNGDQESPSDAYYDDDEATDDFEDYCNQLYQRYEGDDRECKIAGCKLNRSILEISLNIDPTSEDLPYECTLNGNGYPYRHWVPITFMWKASALCHKPLYFEQRQLERYGHSAGPFAQPFVSGAHFFANLAFLPYQMGIHPPNECQYALGYYRPGSCAPWLIDPIPFSLRGAAMQAAAVAGAAYLLP